MKFSSTDQYIDQQITRQTNRLTDKTSKLHLDCFLVASKLHLNYIQIASKLHQDCIQDVSKLNLNCIQIASILHINCICIASKMQLDYIIVASKRFGLVLSQKFYFFGRVGGWLVGEIDLKANSAKLWSKFKLRLSLAKNLLKTDEIT